LGFFFRTIENVKLSQDWWFMSVILTSQEADTSRIAV
jgi:hypothetical protein